MRHAGLPCSLALAAAAAACNAISGVGDFTFGDAGAGGAGGSGEGGASTSQVQSSSATSVSTTAGSGGSSSTASTTSASTTASSTGTGAPVCGDGVVAPTEQCDDGNMTSYDGCSSTCEQENIEDCPGVTVQLDVGSQVAIAGDTTGAVDDENSQACSNNAGHGDLVYRVIAAQAGTIHAVLLTSASLKVYARGTCGALASEIACSSVGPNPEIDVPVTAGNDYFFWVDGLSGEGAFTLTLDFL